MCHSVSIAALPPGSAERLLTDGRLELSFRAGRAMRAPHLIEWFCLDFPERCGYRRKLEPHDGS